MSYRGSDYARWAFEATRHAIRYRRHVAEHGLPCQACGGRGKIGYDSDYHGPADPCGWCETTGLVTRWMRGFWLRYRRAEKLAKVAAVLVFGLLIGASVTASPITVQTAGQWSPVVNPSNSGDSWYSHESYDQPDGYGNVGFFVDTIRGLEFLHLAGDQTQMVGFTLGNMTAMDRLFGITAWDDTIWYAEATHELLLTVRSGRLPAPDLEWHSGSDVGYIGLFRYPLPDGRFAYLACGDDAPIGGAMVNGWLMGKDNDCQDEVVRFEDALDIILPPPVEPPQPPGCSMNCGPVTPEPPNQPPQVAEAPLFILMALAMAFGGRRSTRVMWR